MDANREKAADAPPRLMAAGTAHAIRST